MYFHVLMGTECNSECRYCYTKSCEDFGNDLGKKFKIDFSMPRKVNYSIKELKDFVERGNKADKHILTFYGGEPLMYIDKIKEIMDNVDVRFMIQTNGLLLDKLPSKYVNRFDVMLVSIDGDKKITDFNKGKGTYDQVMKNIGLIKKNGFKGELIARMVTDEHSMLLDQVKHLISVGFSSIHWQIDAGFYGSDFEKRDFAEFVKKYNLELKQLVDYWVGNMSQNGKVLKLYPFLGMFDSIYHNKKEKLRCGSGFANYTIATNGKISVCPIMHDWVDFQVGDIKESDPDNLKEIYVNGLCSKCDVSDLCGGRCLYANRARLWPENGERMICNTVKGLIEAIKEKLQDIKQLISNDIVKESDFVFEKYTGPEIIP